MDRNGERQSHKHTAGVSPHRAVDKFTNFGKFFDGGNTLPCLRVREAKNCCIQINILAAGKLRIETGAQLEESRNTPADVDPALRGAQNTRDHSKQRAFAGAVFTNDSEAATTLHLYIDVLNRPKGLVVTSPAESQKFFQMIRGMPVNAKALGDLLGMDDRHHGIVYPHF